jgi:hypothetical protein
MDLSAAAPSTAKNIYMINNITRVTWKYYFSLSLSAGKK